MIGIIIADNWELNKIPFEKKQDIKINQFNFSKYIYCDQYIIVVYSGIGITNAAAATQQLISSFEIDKIYNYGSVGANLNLNLYDIIAPKRIYYHDIITPWYKRGQTPGESQFYINSLSLKKSNNLASGSSFLNKKSQVKEIKKEMFVDIFDMETAAIAQIAHKNNINIYVIKVVSDLIGVSSSILGDVNLRIKKAGELAFNKTIELIKNSL